MRKKRTITAVDSDSPMSKGNMSHREKKEKAKLQNRPRKKERMTDYTEEMYCLNQSFEAFVRGTNPDDEDTDYIPALRQFIQVSAELKKKYFPATGAVLTFGTNEFGQIGLSESVESRSRPSLVLSMRNRGVISVACGGLHTLSVTESGEVDSWGCNDEGCLGILGQSTVYGPLQVKGFIPSIYAVAQDVPRANYYWNDLSGGSSQTYKDPMKTIHMKYQEAIVAVDAGDTHSLALSQTGRVYFFGSYKDKDGKSFRDIPPRDDPRQLPVGQKDAPRGQQEWPIHVWQLDGEATQISCGFSVNAAVVKKTKDSKPICMTWGIGECGELSRPAFEPLKKTDDEINALPDNSCSYMKYHIDKIAEDYLYPKQAMFADNFNTRIVKKVTCGGYHLLVIAQDSEAGIGRLFSAGLNNYGQLGHGTEGNNVDRLTKVEYLSDVEITAAAGGQHHSICLDSSGKKLYAFGRSCSGQLGHTTIVPPAGSSEATPILIHLTNNEGKPLDDNPVITEISAGGNQSFAFTETKELYSWGYGFSGALGVGKVDDTDCVTRPKMVDVAVGLNKLREQNGERPVSATLSTVATTGGQHSAILATIQEI